MTTEKQPDPERLERYAKVLYELNQEAVWPPDYDADDWREFAAEVVSVADEEQRELREQLKHADAEYQSLGKHLEEAEAAIERARKLASQWAVLRTYGGAAHKLRKALDGEQ